ISRQRFLFFTVVMLLALVGVFLWADFLWRTNLYGLKWVVLVLFVPMFLQLSFGFCQSFFGFWIRRGNGRKGRIMRMAGDDIDTVPLAPTAILFPVYNEDPARVFAGVRATLTELREADCLDAFEIFVLSDTRDPDTWI